LSLFKETIKNWYKHQYGVTVLDIQFRYEEEYDYTYGGGGQEYSTMSVTLAEEQEWPYGVPTYLQDEELIQFLQNLLAWEDDDVAPS